jgi:CRISPR/Cas system CMR subunit Cmr6 (Cas7 group RAMP superfamily)
MKSVKLEFVSNSASMPREEIKCVTVFKSFDFEIIVVTLTENEMEIDDKKEKKKKKKRNGFVSAIVDNFGRKRKKKMNRALRKKKRVKGIYKLLQTVVTQL